MEKRAVVTDDDAGLAAKAAGCSPDELLAEDDKALRKVAKVLTASPRDGEEDAE